MPGKNPARPVRPDERILALDVLRGFAMLGVLVAYCMWSLGTAPAESYTELDKRIDAVASFAVDGKMYTILAFLFGIGFSMQLGRAADDATAVHYYRRRLVALAAIGLVHALLLRNGDILLPYAVTGFLLIPLRRWSDGALMIATAVALLLPDAARMLWDATGAAAPTRPSPAGKPYLIENAAWVLYWLQMAPFTWPHNLALFILGYMAGRRRLLADLAADRARLVAILLGGVVAGTIFYLLRLQLVASNDDLALRSTLIGLCFTLHCWALASAYIAAILLILGRLRGAGLLSPLGSIGRLALTNYLMQAAVIVPLCLIFGWFDRFTPTTALLLAAALFGLVQLPFSLLWLRSYQFGPAEWLWRWLTYGRAPPLRAAADYAPV